MGRRLLAVLTLASSAAAMACAGDAHPLRRYQDAPPIAAAAGVARGERATAPLAGDPERSEFDEAGESDDSDLGDATFDADLADGFGDGWQLAKAKTTSSVSSASSMKLAEKTEKPSDDPSAKTSSKSSAKASAKSKLRKSLVIGALDDVGCMKSLKKLKIKYARAPGAPKIDQPIILMGPINGVEFDTGRAYKARTIGMGDAIDCRLAVSLYDLAAVVKKHGVTTVLVKSFHRPTQPILDPGAPLRHRIGFAIDIAGFKTKKGATWTIVSDFHGKIGQASCGSAAASPVPDTKVARQLWSMFCEIGATNAFDSGISPNYNASHFDHVHFDLTHDHPMLFFP